MKEATSPYFLKLPNLRGIGDLRFGKSSGTRISGENDETSFSENSTSARVISLNYCGNSALKSNRVTLSCKEHRRLPLCSRPKAPNIDCPQIRW